MENVNLDEYLNIYYNGIGYFNESSAILQSLLMGTLQMDALGLISHKKMKSIHLFINSSVYNMVIALYDNMEKYGDFFEEIEEVGYARFEEYNVDFDKMVKDIDGFENLLLGVHYELLELFEEIIVATIVVPVEQKKKSDVFNKGITDLYDRYVKLYGDLAWKRLYYC